MPVVGGRRRDGIDALVVKELPHVLHIFGRLPSSHLGDAFCPRLSDFFIGVAHIQHLDVAASCQSLDVIASATIYANEADGDFFVRALAGRRLLADDPFGLAEGRCSGDAEGGMLQEVTTIERHESLQRGWEGVTVRQDLSETLMLRRRFSPVKHGRPHPERSETSC